MAGGASPPLQVGFIFCEPLEIEYMGTGDDLSVDLCLTINPRYAAPFSMKAVY